MTENTLVNNSDRRDIVNFLKYDDNIENWTQWENRKAAIANEYPELITAISNLKLAQTALDNIVDGIDQQVNWDE